MKKRKKSNHDNLGEILASSKESYRDQPEELTRRLQWITLLAEEKFKLEREREESTYRLINSQLVASSFIFAAFISFVIALFTSKDLYVSNCVVHTIYCAGGFLFLSVIILLLSLIYRKKARPASVIDICKTYLDKDTVFKNSYSENYGRILSLDTYAESVRHSNNINKWFERIATVCLIAHIFLFALGLVLFIIGR